MRTRNREIKVRLTDEEFNALNEAFARSGFFSRETFIREALQGIHIYERPHVDTPQLIIQMSRLGNNLNQLARWANTKGYVEAKLLRILSENLWALERTFFDMMINPEKAPHELKPGEMDFDGFEEALAECTQAEMQREGNTIDKETKGDLWTILL